MKSDYLITENPLKALLYFALPMIIGNFFQQTYTMADSAIVGRYVGEQALAAVGASYAFTNIFIWIAIGGGIGASVRVSRYFGAGQYKKMKEALYTALLAFLLLSLVLGGIGLLFSLDIMELLATPADVLGLADVYLRVYFLGLPFLFMYSVLSAMFNALGKSRIPLFFLIFSSLFNVLLDWILVTRYGLGDEGSLGHPHRPGDRCHPFLRGPHLGTPSYAFGKAPVLCAGRTASYDPDCPAFHPPAVHRLHRHDAGPVGGQWIRFGSPGRFFRCHAGGRAVRGPHGRHRQRYEPLYGPEPGG